MSTCLILGPRERARAAARGMLTPTPYTPHPTPYTLHPTPTPYTLQPALHIVYPTPYTCLIRGPRERARAAASAPRPTAPPPAACRPIRVSLMWRTLSSHLPPATVGALATRVDYSHVDSGGRARAAASAPHPTAAPRAACRQHGE